MDLYQEEITKHLRQNRPGLVAVILVMMAAIFVLDIRMPLGIATWLAYIVPVLLTFWLSRAATILITSGSVLLMLLGFALSPPALPAILALVNRLIGIGVLTVTAWFLLQRRSAEIALRESEARLRATLDGALDAVVGADTQGRIIHWNPWAEELFGWRAEEVLGRTLSATIIPPELREPHERGLRRFHETGRGTILQRRIEMTALRRNGEQFPVELTVIPLVVSGTYEFTAFLRDITERKRVQEQLEQWSQRLEHQVSERTEALQTANLKLRELDCMRSAFVSIATHEMRTPLTSTLGFVENMLDGVTGALTSQQGQYLTRIKENVTRLTRLISDLLDLTLLEEGHLRLHLTETGLSEVVRETVETLQPLARKKSVRLSMRVPDSLPAVQADKDKLHQALTNIVQNAIKFTPSGGVVTIEAEVEKGQAVRVAVDDTGPGLSTDEIPKVFEKFYTGRDVPGERRGVGLGLAITKSLIELQGGTVGVESRVGVGSRFFVTLPLSPQRK